MAAFSAIASGVGAVAGAAGGILGSGDQTTSNVQRVMVDDPSLREQMFRRGVDRRFGELEGLIGLGPGRTDISASLASTRGLAAAFGEAARTGGLPTEADITATRGISERLFDPQRVALEQAFQDRQTDFARQAAISGRPVTDPILQAKMAQERTRAEERLQANIGSTAQQLALQQPERRLGFLGQQAQIQGGLASQALQNRQTLLGLGNQLAEQERTFRLNTATRTGSQTTPGVNPVLGGLAGAAGGASLGAGLARGFGGVSSPQVAPQMAAPQPSIGPAFQTGGGVSGVLAPQSAFSGFSQFQQPFPGQTRVFGLGGQ